MSATSSNPTRILLVQLADIGDLILTTPALSALRVAQPQAHLTLLTTTHSAQILERGLVNEVVTLDKAQISGALSVFRPATLKQIWALGTIPFDQVIFFHHFTLWLGTLKFALIARASRARQVIGLDNGNGWFLTERVPDEGFGVQHQAQYWLKLVALLGADSSPQRAQVAFDAGVLPLPVTTRRRAVIHTGSGGYSLARRWPTHYFAQVADALIEQHEMQVVLVGTPEDGAAEVIQQMQHNPVNLVGRTSLTQLADVIRSADVYIGADSGVMHLAAAVRTPVVAVFGPSNADAWGPWTPNGSSITLRSAPLCSPCSYVDHGIGARAGCVARTCMLMVTPEQVLRATTDLLEERPPQPLRTTARGHVDAPTLVFSGIACHWLSEATFITAISTALASPDYWQVVLCDYAYLSQARRDPILRVIVQRAALVVPCGDGLAWAASWKHNYLPQNLHAGVLLAHTLRTTASQQKRVFLLGTHAEAAAQVLQRELPELIIAGALNASDHPDAEADLSQRIHAAQADLLIVGWPQARGEAWLARNAPRLGVRVGIAIGQPLMQEMAGRGPRVPETLLELRLGWLYLALREPRRLRALWQFPYFVVRIVLRG